MQASWKKFLRRKSKSGSSDPSSPVASGSGGEDSNSSSSSGGGGRSGDSTPTALKKEDSDTGRAIDGLPSPCMTKEQRAEYDAFEAEIQTVVLLEPVDLNALRCMSRMPGGFRSRRIRTSVWPVLLGINDDNIVVDYHKHIAAKHKDFDQVQVDIDRSLWRLDAVLHWSESERDEQRVVMMEIINAILSRNASLNYFQGFHDVVTVFFLVFRDPILTFSAAEAMCSDFIADSMHETFDTISELLKLMFIIIGEFDRPLYNFFVKAESEPYFALSWFLTWFSHDVIVLNDISRIFDALLCSHPSFILYICSAYVMSHRTSILKLEGGFGAVHNHLVRLPVDHGLPFEDILKDADRIYAAFPHEDLIMHASPTLTKLLAQGRVTMFRDPSDSFLSLSPTSGGSGTPRSGAGADRGSDDKEEVDAKKSSKKSGGGDASSATAAPNAEGLAPSLSARRIIINKWRLAKIENISRLKKSVLKRCFVVLHYVRHGSHPVFEFLNYLWKERFQDSRRVVFSLLSIAIAGYISYVYKLP